MEQTTEVKDILDSLLDPGKPTGEVGALLQDAFDHFNARLFNGELSQPMIVLKPSKRAGASGHHRARCWVDARSSTLLSEIAINPEMFAVSGATEAAQTLVHEMCHLWQHEHGSPSRAGYHNLEWAAKMQLVGLMPSDTGQPGGKTTGQAMADYPIEGGPFLAALAEFARWELRWAAIFSPAAIMAAVTNLGLDASALPTAPASTSGAAKKKIGYRCPRCGSKAWGKPELNLICGDCHEEMIA
jgi:predicted SprT family Zn-dependent metalloprotease